MATINESISRVKGSIKAIREDAFITDRLVWTILKKYAYPLIKRQSVLEGIMSLHDIFTPIPCVDLIEVDRVSDSCCAGIKSGCKIMRTKKRIPKVVESYKGPLFRQISTIDGSKEFYMTTPLGYNAISRSSTFKYNNNKYFWYFDGYLYFPDVEYQLVTVEAIWEDSIAEFTCMAQEVCKNMQQRTSFIPDTLLADVEKYAKEELGVMLQIPSDNFDNNNNLIRP